VRGPFDAKLPDGSTLTIEPVVRTRRRVGLGEGLKHFDPCTVLLNTDLARGAPPSIVNLNEQFLLPPLHAGWTVRRKSRHFHAYDEVAKRFAKLVSMDPWLLAPLVAACGEVNLREARGLDCVKTHTDALLTKIRRKYKDYGITERPFVVVKPDDGIPGMDMITVHDAAEIDALAQAALGSGAAEGPHALIVQEGVPTHERVNDAVAEPVVYMIDRYVVGGFYRVHAARGVDQNLDAPGAAFVPLAFADSPQLPRRGERPGASPPNRFYMYGVVARLAMLAASYELEATDPQALEAA
jgi:glutamate--cysteine ligase